MDYNQEEKEIARQLVLANAIKSLTTAKDKPSLIGVDYVRRVKEFLTSGNNKFDKEFTETL